MIKVSVVIPAYNSSKFICTAIESALGQSLKPYEIIVIDDGSTDGTRKKIEKYDKDIKYYFQNNAGSGKARNKGIIKAKGEYVAFLDSDDFWDKEYLEIMYKALNKDYNCAFAYCGKKWVDEKDELISDIQYQNIYPSGWIFYPLFNDNYISTASAVFARKSKIIEAGLFSHDKKLRNAQDYELWLRIAARNKIASVSKKLVYYRTHKNNRSLDNVKRIIGHLHALNSALDLIIKNEVSAKNNVCLSGVRRRMKDSYDGAVKSLFYLREFNELKVIIVEAIRKNFFNGKMLIIYLVSLFPKKIIMEAQIFYNTLKKIF